MIVPLTAQGCTFGAVSFLWNGSGRRYDPADLVLARDLANRAALALNNAHLYRQALAEIAARKQVEQQLQVALQEKEALLKEVYHRVKNNLQGIANLLYMQASYLQDPQARQMFQETQDRVRSIALIHEKLYQSGNLAHLDFAEYVNSLVAYLVRSYGADARGVRLAVQADPVPLDMDTAISLGMIINELVANCLKHAFPATWTGQAAEISIELRAAPSHLRLIVGDNGIGLPAGLEPVSARSLGLQLVTMLTGHMRGTLAVSRENGTIFTLEFTSLAPAVT